MKVSKDYILREVEDDFVIMPTGRATQKFKGLITVNEVGASVWKMLQHDVSMENLVQGILDEYEVEAEIAREDIAEFLKELSDNGILEKDGKDAD